MQSKDTNIFLICSKESECSVYIHTAGEYCWYMDLAGSHSLIYIWFNKMLMYVFIEEELVHPAVYQRLFHQIQEWYHLL